MKKMIMILALLTGASAALADSAPTWSCSSEENVTVSMSMPYVGESMQDIYMQTLVTINLAQYRTLYFLDPIERNANELFDQYPNLNEADIVFEGANNKAGYFKLVLTQIEDKSTTTYIYMTAQGMLSMTSALGHVQSYKLNCELM